MVVGIMRGIVAFIVSAILGGICLMIGFSPEEWIATVVAEPPWWLLHPLTRIASDILALLFGLLMWKFRPWRARSATKRDDDIAPIVKLTVGDTGPYLANDGSVFDNRRTYKVKLENTDQRDAISRCVIRVLNVEPPTEYEGPWLLKQGVSLAAGDHIFIPLVTYVEAREPNKYACGDTFMTMGTANGHPCLDIDKQYTITLRATAPGTAYGEAKCKIWIGDDGRLQIAGV